MADLTNISPAPAVPTAAAAADITTAPTVPVHHIHDTDSESSVDYSIVDNDSTADTDSVFNQASTQGDIGEQIPIPLSLAEAFELLSVGAAAVSAAVAQASVDANMAALAAAAPAPGKQFSSTGPWVAGTLYNVVPPTPLAAVPDNSEKWYAITKGRYVGLTTNSSISSNGVSGVSNALQNGTAWSLSFNFSPPFPQHDWSDAGAVLHILFEDGQLSPISRFASPRVPTRSVMATLEERLARLSLASAPSRSPSSTSSLSISSGSTEYFSTGDDDNPNPSTRRPSTPPPRTPLLPESSRLDEAADATIGVPHGRSRRLTPRGRKSQSNSGGYAAFFGRNPGWREAQGATSGAPGAIFQSYLTPTDARAAFEYAQTRTWTGVTSGHSAVPSARVAVARMPVPVSDESHTSPLHCGAWYIVYKGLLPGVYQSSLECALNTTGIRGCTFDSATDSTTATRHFLDVIRHGHTRTLPSPVSVEFLH
ncbi:hypothetical protein C8R44DRAFT_872372 [Mycena epipterygia]|nr:hypothetical protein C8R44DRAFT_872372 [Mycena epipterygia]